MNLVRYASAHIQHMQKALSQMNLQLANVVADIAGVTGMRIIKAVLAGERDAWCWPACGSALQERRVDHRAFAAGELSPRASVQPQTSRGPL